MMKRIKIQIELTWFGNDVAPSINAYLLVIDWSRAGGSVEKQIYISSNTMYKIPFIYRVHYLNIVSLIILSG